MTHSYLVGWLTPGPRHSGAAGPGCPVWTPSACASLGLTVQRGCQLLTRLPGELGLRMGAVVGMSRLACVSQELGTRRCMVWSAAVHFPMSTGPQRPGDCQRSSSICCCPHGVLQPGCQSVRAQTPMDLSRCQPGHLDHHALDHPCQCCCGCQRHPAILCGGGSGAPQHPGTELGPAYPASHADSAGHRLHSSRALRG